MKGAAHVEQPVTGAIAAKFEDSAQYQELVKQWDEQAKEKSGATRPVGAPLGAMRSLGEVLVASMNKQLEEQDAQEGQEGILRLEQKGEEAIIDLEGLPDFETLQAAE